MTALLPKRHTEPRLYPGAGAVLALDMANHTGWAVHRPDGQVSYSTADFSLEKGEGIGIRWLRFGRWLTDKKNQLGTIERVFFEELNFIGTSVLNAKVKFGFEATLTRWCAHHGIPCKGIPPQTIKKFITGDGRAKKPAVIAAVEQLGLNPNNDNEADALALLTLGLERMEGSK